METAKSNQLVVSRKHSGSRHCGAVRFEVELPENFGGSRCNCSVCARIAATSALLKPAAFTLLSEPAALHGYAWGARISTRHFCKECGVHCFGRGHLAEVGGDYVSVNLNCLDGVDVNELELIHWDGRHDNWEAGPRGTPWPVHTPSGAAA